MRPRRSKNTPKPKRLAYELIRDEPGSIGRQAYVMLRELISAFRRDLVDARIALAWCTSWKPDADGRVTIGKCRKASDLDRELMEYDFIILLSRTFWLDLEVTDQQRRALLDHELMHAAVKCTESGDPEEDAKGRIVYRVRKHDIEEFADTVRRHGIYRGDLDHFAAALRAAAMRGYVPCAECKSEGTPGWRAILVPVPGEPGRSTSRMQRCGCFTAHLQRVDPETAPAPQPKQSALPTPTTSSATH
jgi:putative metallopeptidase